MDLEGYWQENKRFVAAVAAGVLVFFAAFLFVRSSYADDLRSARRRIAEREADLARQLYSSGELAAARSQNDALRAAVEELRAAAGFRPRPEFRLAGDVASASHHYLRTLTSVREELLPLASRANLELDPDLGLPPLSPTREAEIERYLEALDAIETLVRHATAAGIDRIERIDVRLDPGLHSREGVGELERTRVACVLFGDSRAVTELLTRTQRPAQEGGRVLHLEEVQIVPSRAKEDEVRLELTLVLPRLRPEELEEA